MKINEILLETTDDDNILLKIARAATPKINQAVEDYLEFGYNLTLAAEPIGTIGELSGFHGKDAYEILLDVPVILLIERTTSRGYWENGAIHLNCKTWNGESHASLMEPRTIRSIMSTFLHEMRHALDDILSDGHYRIGSRKFEYLDRRIERNARYTQAIKSMIDHIENNPQDIPEFDSKNIIQLIKNHFDEYNVPYDKRLMTRAYNYVMRWLSTDYNTHAPVISTREFPPQERLHPRQIGTATLMIKGLPKPELSQYSKDLNNIGTQVPIMKRLVGVSDDAQRFTILLPTGETYTTRPPVNGVHYGIGRIKWNKKPKPVRK